LIPLQIEGFKEKLEDISDSATKEYSIQRTLEKMAADWEPLNFDTKDWRETFILDGEAVELITTQLDDNIIKAQTMKGSPFAYFFQEKIQKWETMLLQTQENLEMWLKVQSVWLYLEPVFSSDDIMHQMPKEGTKFKGVDRSWRALMTRVDNTKRALTIMEWDDIGKILNTAHADLEEV